MIKKMAETERGSEGGRGDGGTVRSGSEMERERTRGERRRDRNRESEESLPGTGGWWVVEARCRGREREARNRGTETEKHSPDL